MSPQSQLLRRKVAHTLIHRSIVLSFLVGFLAASFIQVLFLRPLLFGESSASTAACDLVSNNPKQKFRGVQWWKQGFTQKVQTLYETAFSRFQIHTVLLEDGKTVVNDWMWCDEADHINVLVETEDNNDNKKYLVFSQTKYAMTGQTLAILGGLMEPGESALQSAQRELQEELGFVSDTWISLGAYRVAANRGGGHTHAFLARNAKPGGKQRPKTAGIAMGESERQDIVYLSRDELLEALLAGKFQEVKWTATIALAILQTQQQ